MKYSKNWLYIDILNLLAFLPLLFILPIFMQLFFILALVVIIKDKSYYKPVLFGGLIMVVISFLSSFNLTEIPKFTTYITMLVSLLIVAVLAQRVTKEKNIYITLAPFLFFGFSILFFQNLYMLFYSIFLLFIFLIVKYYEKIEDINIAFKESIKLFLISLPIVAILFIIFPRYNIKSPKIGFKANYSLSGFSDSMTVSDNSVISSNKVVMEVGFEKEPKNLYFRGAVLNKNIGNKWIKKELYKDILKDAKDKINYTIKQYPTNKKYIFALDLPFHAPKKTYLTSNYTIHSIKPIKNTLNLKIASYENYKLIPNKIPKILLQYDKTKNLATQKLLQNIKKINNDFEKLKKLKELFIKQKIAYTKKPPKMDIKNSVDELFKLKKGYCVHFSSAFATTARMVNLPSRVVSGFLGNKSNMYKNYIIIKESDAHAWVEVYIKNRGWIRVDPTTFAYKNISSQTEEENISQKVNSTELYMMYIKFKIEQWVLYYDSYKQEKLKKLLQKKEFLVKFILIFILIVALIIFILYWIKKEKINTEDKLIAKLIKNKPSNITTYNYLKSFNNSNLDEINRLYHKIKFYKSNKEDINKLKKLIKALKKAR